VPETPERCLATTGLRGTGELETQRDVADIARNPGGRAFRACGGDSATYRGLGGAGLANATARGATAPRERIGQARPLLLDSSYSVCDSALGRLSTPSGRDTLGPLASEKRATVRGP
jgi:hypothetical protein